MLNIKNYCCDFMRQQLNYKCEQHGDGEKCPDVVIGFRETSIHGKWFALVGRNANYSCNYCPYCGSSCKKMIRELKMNEQN